MTRAFRRAQQKKFLKEQKAAYKQALRQVADTRFAIAWKRKEGVYEAGRTGPP